MGFLGGVEIGDCMVGKSEEREMEKGRVERWDAEKSEEKG